MELAKSSRNGFPFSEYLLRTGSLPSSSTTPVMAAAPDSSIGPSASRMRSLPSNFCNASHLQSPFRSSDFRLEPEWHPLSSIECPPIVSCFAVVTLPSAMPRVPLGFRASSRQLVPPIWSAADALRDHSLPILIVQGDRDRLFPRQMGRDLLSLLWKPSRPACPSCPLFTTIPSITRRQSTGAQSLSWFSQPIKPLTC